MDERYFDTFAPRKGTFLGLPPHSQGQPHHSDDADTLLLEFRRVIHSILTLSRCQGMRNFEAFFFFLSCEFNEFLPCRLAAEVCSNNSKVKKKVDMLTRQDRHQNTKPLITNDHNQRHPACPGSPVGAIHFRCRAAIRVTQGTDKNDKR